MGDWVARSSFFTYPNGASLQGMVNMDNTVLDVKSKGHESKLKRRIQNHMNPDKS
jgi:hypothetical protein